MSRRLYNVILTSINALFYVLFNLLYIFLVFVPSGFTTYSVVMFYLFSDLFLIALSINVAFLLKAFREHKRYLEANEYTFGERISFLNYNMFVRKTDELIGTKKDQYIISFSPIKISINYEIYQGKEIRLLNKSIALYLNETFGTKEYEKKKVRMCYDNYCFIIYIRASKEEVLNIVEMIEQSVYEIAKTEDIRLFVQTFFGMVKVQGNIQLFELINRANIARRIAEYNYEKVVEYEDKMSNAEGENSGLTKEIVDGLKNNEFVVYYQPKYNLGSKQFIGAEALVRWNHPTLGIVSPVKFIHFAENRGLIHEIDLYVLEQVCKNLADEKKRGRKLLPVSVNFSVYEFYCPTFISDIKSTIERYGVNPLLIEVEITEETTHANSFLVISILKNLKDYGLKILLDDFGVGFSNIKSIKNLPIDVIKIDKSFIDEIVFDYKSREIVKTIINLAKAMSYHVIAEGVDNEEQVDVLKKLRCDTIQGFYYSKPMPLKEYEKFLKSNPFEKKGSN